MKKLLLLAALLILFFAVNETNAQSAVYFCTETGAYGYCYAADTKYDAEDCAYDYCVSYGGTSPTLIVSTGDKGYGAIALGKNSDGYRVIGAAVGYTTLKDAKDDAIDACKNSGGRNVKVEHTWYDY